MAMREKYAEIAAEREKTAAMRSMNDSRKALIAQQIKESQNKMAKENDLVDVGGFKVPRSKAVDTMATLADVKYKLNKIDEDQYMQDLNKAYKLAVTNEALNRGKNSLAAAKKNRMEMLILKEKLDALNEIKQTGEISDANAAILGRTKPTVKPPQTYSQASALLKSEMVSTNFMGGIQDPVAQKRYAAATDLLAELWRSGKQGPDSVTRAREAIYRAEQTCVNKYLKAKGNPAEQKKILDSFVWQFGYLPPEISSQTGEE